MKHTFVLGMVLLVTSAVQAQTAKTATSQPKLSATSVKRIPLEEEVQSLEKRLATARQQSLSPDAITKIEFHLARKKEELARQEAMKRARAAK